jgi:NADPH-dependent glutamate synthase beta subunit-like oxidoreductase
MILKFAIQFEDLYHREGLTKVDTHFMAFLKSTHPDLAALLIKARQHQESLPSEALLRLSPLVEDFVAELFNITPEVHTLQHQHHALAPLWQAKRHFVQRRALKKYPTLDSLPSRDYIKEAQQIFGTEWDELSFAQTVLRWLETPAQIPVSDMEFALQYAAWATLNPEGQHHHPQSVVFGAVAPTDVEKVAHALQTSSCPTRDHFDAYDTGLSQRQAMDQARYCLWCHHRKKDTCRHGLSEEKPGCPLDQKISEMAELKAQGFCIGALATIMIDNPMVAATGHRICNDCRQSCIFQSQEPVNVPGLETQILQDVLALPWGFEIYSLLSRWNPLNTIQPLPQPDTGKTVLVVGLGPAGFTLSHYLLNSGHQVIAIDGLKIEPLPAALSGQTLDQGRSKFIPIRTLQDYYQPLSQRPPQGFGGVTEYGITVRWDKNFLLPIRLLLERRHNFTMQGGIRFGSTLTPDQAFTEFGADHIALCLGAGKPNAISLPWEDLKGQTLANHGLPPGVHLGADFLMALQGVGAAQSPFVDCPMTGPVVVIGGGLTAIDAATEAQTFLRRQGDMSPVVLLYRGELAHAPSVNLNAPEVISALRQGLQIHDQTTPSAFVVDDHGRVCGLKTLTPHGERLYPARTILVATGTHPNTVIAEEWPELFPLNGKFFQSDEVDSILLPTPDGDRTRQQRFSFFGDIDARYYGSVVKAMASAKHGYPVINRLLAAISEAPHPKPPSALDLPRVLESRQIGESGWYHVRVHAPLAARQFQPGALYKLHRFNQFEYTYAPHAAVKSLAVTGIAAQGDDLEFLIWETPGTAAFYTHLQPGEPLIVMGPAGLAAPLPQHQRVLVVAEDLLNVTALALLPALTRENLDVTYHAIYTEAQMICPWQAPIRPSIMPNLHESQKTWDTYDHLVLCTGSALPPVSRPYTRIISTPVQCMMKGICGRCLAPGTKPGEFVFSCQNNWQQGA